jgi:hypothetical protein
MLGELSENVSIYLDATFAGRDRNLDGSVLGRERRTCRSKHRQDA